MDLWTVCSDRVQWYGLVLLTNCAVDDQDMAQIDDITSRNQKKLVLPETKVDIFDDDDDIYDFPHDEELAQIDMKPVPTHQSNGWTQLPNGNWQCRHKCADKTK